VFLRKNPIKGHLDLTGLVEAKALTQNEYDFLEKEKIKYNPPSSARPHDNYISIFDLDVDDDTSCLVLHDLVEESTVTKTGTISELDMYLDQWDAFRSEKKSVSLSKEQDFYYFTISYFNNSHWNKQHLLLIRFPETSQKEISRLRELIRKYEILYHDYVAQSHLHFDLMLPPELSTIKKICYDILAGIFAVSPNDVIHYTPDGCRFHDSQERLSANR